MKNTIKITVLLLIFTLSAHQNYAQGKIATEHLYGSWTIDYATSLEKTNSHAQKHLSKMKPERRKRIEGSYKNRQITFYVNGDYHQRFSDGRQISGIWLNQKEKILEIRTPKGAIKRYKLIWLSASNLTLKPIVRGRSKPVLETLYFIKN